MEKIRNIQSHLICTRRNALIHRRGHEEVDLDLCDSMEKLLASVISWLVFLRRVWSGFYDNDIDGATDSTGLTCDAKKKGRVGTSGGERRFRVCARPHIRLAISADPVGQCAAPLFFCSVSPLLSFPRRLSRGSQTVSNPKGCKDLGGQTEV